MSSVVASLVELMADPHYRSISGFETLIQKEWVALGHPFTIRHKLTQDLSSEEDRQAVSCLPSELGSFQLCEPRFSYT